jgi:LPS export ABC transporter protein LptC
MRGPAGFALLLALAGCKEKPVPVSTATLPSQVIEQFTLHESSSGERLYSLEAERAFVFDPEQRVDVVRLHVRFYDETGGVHSVLDADEGTIYQNENLVARGSVSVRTSDSTVLRTDSLAWNNPTRQVRTDAPVEITTPKGRVSGRGLVSDAGLANIEIQSEVTGTSDYDFETGR